MKNWHEEHIESLTTGIVNEFNYLFTEIKENNDCIYAVVICLDSDILTGYLVIGTKNTVEMRKKQDSNWDFKWMLGEWDIATETHEIDNGVHNLFLHEMRRHFENDIEPKLMQGGDYTEEREKNLWLFMQGMKNAKEILKQNYTKALESTLFYLSIPGDEVFEIKTAKALNEPSALLTEMIRENS